jgi:hypothetical protein
VILFVRSRICGGVNRCDVYNERNTRITVAVCRYAATLYNYFDKMSSVHIKALDDIHAVHTMYVHA